MTIRKKSASAGTKRLKGQEFHSFDEYRGKFYPNTIDQNVTQFDEPRNIGIEVARETLKKMRNK